MPRCNLYKHEAHRDHFWFVLYRKSSVQKKIVDFLPCSLSALCLYVRITFRRYIYQKSEIMRHMWYFNILSFQSTHMHIIIPNFFCFHDINFTHFHTHQTLRIEFPSQEKQDNFSTRNRFSMKISIKFFYGNL